MEKLITSLWNGRGTKYLLQGWGLLPLIYLFNFFGHISWYYEINIYIPWYHGICWIQKSLQIFLSSHFYLSFFPLHLWLLLMVSSWARHLPPFNLFLIFYPIFYTVKESCLSSSIFLLLDFEYCNST